MPAVDGTDRLLPRHGRAFGKICRSLSDLLVEDGKGRIKIIIDAQIRCDDPGACMLSEHIDRSPAANEIQDHLGGHFLGKEADPFGDNPVIAGAGHDDFVPEANVKGSCNGSQPGGYVLENAQAAGRARLIREPCKGLFVNQCCRAS